MLKATRENWREVFEDSKKNTTETLTFTGKSYSIAIFPQVYGTLTEEEFYKEIAGIIIEESRMEYEFKEGDEYERTTRKQTKEEKRID
ncbi:hypothetical protein ACTJJD_11295 [Bacillus sp. 22446]|uniref:hypothetical protein n=1 Tax=Bacillus sp. 22446 TaxID=3453918 RepID=UPI003F83F52E